MAKPAEPKKELPAPKSGDDVISLSINNFYEFLATILIAINGLLKFIAKGLGIFYAVILLFIIIIYFPLLLFDASITSFPNDKNITVFSSNIYKGFSLQFQSNYQLLLFFSAVTGGIGGCVNAFYIFIRTIETDEFKKKGIKDISLDVTILMASMVLRGIVGAGLGMLACFALTSGVLTSLILDTTTLPTGPTKGVNNQLIGALSLISGLFANKVIDRVGKRLGE